MRINGPPKNHSKNNVQDINLYLLCRVTNGAEQFYALKVLLNVIKYSSPQYDITVDDYKQSS
jgi:hypothetical protein